VKLYIRLRALAAEVTRVTLEVGSQGKLGCQAHVPDVEGVWFELVRNVCFLLLIAKRSSALYMVTTAMARGDLTEKIEISVDGEISTLKGTANCMADKLSAFASEVTWVAMDVGTQGILGGQATVEGVQGTWADLARNVNKMASNLTDQVRSISEVTKAVALNGKIVRILEGGGSKIDLDGKCYCLRWRLYASTCLFRPQRFHHHQCPPQTIDPFRTHLSSRCTNKAPNLAPLGPETTVQRTGKLRQTSGVWLSWRRGCGRWRP
ncbi:hypothetical protein K443DRAFT_681288, partial [Laccaria amethystina LaAM-08-1]